MNLEATLQQILQLANTQYEQNQHYENQNYISILKSIFETQAKELDEAHYKRLQNELFEFGPLQPLMVDEDISEIIFSGPNQIFFERQGSLFTHPDHFLSEFTFRNAFERIQNSVNTIINQENPFFDGAWGPFRVSIVDPSINQGGYLVSLRRHPENPWTFEKLLEVGWADSNSIEILKKMIHSRQNFLVIGPTGCGKTSVMNALLAETGTHCRNVIIEDASELKLPNRVSSKLLTRRTPFNEDLKEIDQAELVKRSLRLRPDRMVMGEIRGPEAKDFLMALATGHAGSFASLHAQDPHQALIRLEMLIQMGAPQWTATAIRQLIHLSLDCIVVLHKSEDGCRKLKSVFQLKSLEPHGFLLEQVAL